MCYHKSLVDPYQALMDHYAASFESITEELDIIKERFSILMSRDEKAVPYTDDERAELGCHQKTLQSFTDTQYRRYHENGFDYLPAPIITAGAPEKLKLFRWGLIPHNMSERSAAYNLRLHTLNCVSEEMYEKPSFKDAVKNEQRCLIPVSGFYEWQWKDDKGKEKIPHYIYLKDRPITSLAGIYSRWKDPRTSAYYYSYSILTTKANEMMEEIHNSKKRMPVIIPRAYEKAWLNRGLSKDDVMDLCRPIDSNLMGAHTIARLISQKGVDTNIPEIHQPYSYTEQSGLFS
jgi:putative SOS response-associated peptidase YedK